MATPWRDVCVVLACAFLPCAPTASADPISVVETPCATPEHDWRCFGFESPALLTTTFAQPELDWTILPTLPEDPENWRLILLTAGFGAATYQFVYPLSSSGGGASLGEISLIDSQGGVLLSTALFLNPVCSEATAGPNAGKLVCSDGNSLISQFSFEEGIPSGPDPPSLDGPFVIHVRWDLFGSDVPETSSLNVSGANLFYVFERDPIPEPSTGGLLMGGLLGLAAWRRRRRPLCFFRVDLIKKE